MLMGQMKPGLSKKRGMKSNFHAKRSSLNSKENKKGLSHFNLNGIITLGGKGIYGLANRSIKTKPHKVLKRGNKSSNFNFTVLKKNLSSKQNVLYSSLNQPGGRMGFNRSQKQVKNVLVNISRVLRKSSNKNFSPMIMGNIKKRHSDKNILSHKYSRVGSKGSLLQSTKGKGSIAMY